MSHIAAATVPPRFVTLAILSTAWSALLIQATTSEHIAASNVPSSQGSDSATPAHVRARDACLAGSGECGAGSIAATLSSPTRPANSTRARRAAADVEDPHAGAHAGGIGELRRQPGGIAAHEAVVVLDCGGELDHGATKPDGGRVRQPSRSLRHGRAGAVTKASPIDAGTTMRAGTSREIAGAAGTVGRGHDLHAVRRRRSRLRVLLRRRSRCRGGGRG